MRALLTSEEGDIVAGSARLTWIFAVVMLFCICGILVAHFALIPWLNVNWDEFHYLSEIYSHQRGAYVPPVNSAHVFLFSWVADLPGFELDQIIWARRFVFLLLALSYFLLFLLLRPHLSKLATLFAVLCAASSSLTVEHGASFRADTVCLFLILTSCIVLRPRDRQHWRLLFASLLFALAFVLNWKSAIFFPVVLGVKLLGVNKGGGAVKLLATSLLAFFFACLVAFALHVRALAPEKSQVVTNVTKVSQQVLSAVSEPIQQYVALEGPGVKYLLIALRDNPFAYLSLLLGVACYAIARRGKEKYLPLNGAPLFLAIGASFLLSLLCYRNLYPYFLAMCSILLSSFCGYFYDFLLNFSREKKAIWQQLSLVLAIVFPLGVMRDVGATIIFNYYDQTVAQRSYLEVIHKLSPEPVRYLDRGGMVSSFPMAGHFLSTWELTNYHRGLKRSLRAIVETYEPRFILGNIKALNLAQDPRQYSQGDFPKLTASDFEFLKSRYLRFWGRIFVLGTEIALQPGQSKEFITYDAGRYQFLGEGELQISEQKLLHKAQIELPKGRHVLHTASGAQGVLRLAVDAGNLPPVPRQPIFLKFDKRGE